MRITMTLEVTDPADHDPTHSMGITTTAYERLTDALSDAGFEILNGPNVEQS